MPVPALRTAFLLLLACACAHGPEAVTLTFAEAGLVETHAPANIRLLGTPLEIATHRFLLAAERETGEWPAFDEPEMRRETGRSGRPQGWAAERSALAAEVLRALDSGDATVRSLSRARDALRWDRMFGAARAEVDDHLANTALARAEAALPASPALPGRVPDFRWPLEAVTITSAFGVRSDPFGEGSRRHAGVDLAAQEGQYVSAAAAGEVRFAGPRGGYGLHVEIRHTDGFISRYAHLSQINVAPGDVLSAGDIVGRAGRTGRATGPHLHFELWRDGLPLDPAEEIDRAERARYTGAEPLRLSSP